MAYPHKILQAGQNYHIRGGSDRYMLSLSRLLQDKGHSAIPFATRHPDNLETPWSGYFPPRVNFEQPGIRDVLRYLYSRPAAIAMTRLLHDETIDIAHLHIYYGQLTGSILSPLKAAGVPIVQTLHEYKLVCPVYKLYHDGLICEDCQGRHFLRAIPNRCNRRSLVRSALSAGESILTRKLGAIEGIDHFIAVSQFMKNKFVELGVPSDKITTVHNYIHVDDYLPNYSPGNYAVFFGRFEPNKGIMTLLEAAKANRDIPIMMVGQGSLYEMAMSYVQKHGLDNVTLSPFVEKEKLAELVHGSICTVLPSEWYEGFPMAILESLAMGKPVVTSNLGGMAEAVCPGEDGLLFTAGDHVELGSKLRWFYENPGNAVDMGRAGRVKVVKDYNSELHYQKVMEVYKRVSL